MTTDAAIMIVPALINDATLLSSNIPEDDYDNWVAGTFAEGDRVIRSVTHSVYEALTDHTGTLPPEQDGVNWIRVGSTNRFRAFDSSVGQSANKLELITYKVSPLTRCDSIALINMVAVTVQVIVRNGANVVVYDQTKDLVDTSGIENWLDYFLFDGEYQPEHVFINLPINPDGSVEIKIQATTGATAEVGEIVIGKSVELGIVLDQSRSGFTDYTIRQQDPFGNVTFTVRPTARKAEWVLESQTTANRRIQRALEQVRGVTCYFHPGDGMSSYYLGVLGVADDYFPALAAGGYTRSTLSLTGVS